MLLSKHPQGNQKEVISLRKWEKVCLGLFCAVLIAVFAWLITLDSRNSHIGNLVMKPGIYPLAKPDLSPSLANNEYLVLSYNATKKQKDGCLWLYRKISASSNTNSNADIQISSMSQRDMNSRQKCHILGTSNNLCSIFGPLFNNTDTLYSSAARRFFLSMHLRY